MALVTVTNPETGKVWEYYMDDRLKKNLDKRVIPALKIKDEDYVFVIDGGEREGKSSLAIQIARYVDPSLNLDRIIFNPTNFKEVILKAKKGQCIIFDEAFRGLASRGALTEMNKVLVGLMMEMGQKNLCVIIVLPTFFLLEKYVAIFRSRGLIHVYKSKKGQKGYWVYFNKRKRKILYLKGKKEFDYRVVKSKFRGRFYGKLPIEEDGYRLKKKLALREFYKRGVSGNDRKQRDQLIRILFDELRYPQRKFIEYLKGKGFVFSRDSLSKIIKE